MECANTFGASGPRHGVVKLLGTDLWVRLKPFASAMLVVAVLAGCASAPKTAGDTTEDISDPIEPVNRVFFEFNKIGRAHV